MATVYRFETWDIHNDIYQRSRRWATREAIEKIGGVITGEGVDVADTFLGHDVPGMTDRDFNAHRPPSGGFQVDIG